MWEVIINEWFFEGNVDVCFIKIDLSGDDDEYVNSCLG